MFGAGVDGREYSESMSAKIDGEVSKIMNESFAVAREVITKHKPVLEAIANHLIEFETLEQEAYEKIIVAHGIVLKKKKEEVKK